ncbi:F-box associated domain, type 1 [Artemisia annua]|uniref:F-box associated domain, type 1 n=1 Tax=Artemisia annua TaxID=35608 RepID=A0A2U1P6S3_ARTAN|nr:F-box associated domain, type 1 [Artemisia annua]
MGMVADLIELHKKYVQIFKHPVALNGEDLDLDDDNGNDRRLSVMINPSPIKEGNDDGKKDKDAEEQGDEVPETKVDEPLSLTQWIENHLDLIEEWFNLIAAEFYYQKCVAEGTMEPMGVGISGAINPHNIATRASDVSPSPVKRLVKPSSYLLSSYMNKKTKVKLKMTRPEWMLGNSIFAMRGEKLERVFETRSGELYSVRLIMETLAPGLEVDANVIDCLGAILNHEKHSREAGCPLRHFFPTGCIIQTVTMFDGTLKTEDAKFEEFEKEISAQFKDDVGGLALDGVELKTLFACHLKLYGHNKHANIRKVKPRIANLKWNTKNNSIDCGVFTMLHTDNYTGEAPGKWDCGLVAESKEQSNQLRVLRFKLATKILLNEFVDEGPHPGILKLLEIEDQHDHNHLLRNPFMGIDMADLFPGSLISLVGSVNGLVCLWEYLWDEHSKTHIRDNTYICNPITREYMILPKQQYGVINYLDARYGFGVSVKGEYKVIRILGESYKIEVHTLGTDQWRSLDVSKYLKNMELYHGTFFEDLVYWIVNDRLFSFDLDRETFKLFPFPSLPNDETLIVLQYLGVLNGCLSVLYRTPFELCIWVMKDHGTARQIGKFDNPWTLTSKECFPVCLVDGLNGRSILMFNFIEKSDQERNLMAHCIETNTNEDTAISDKIFKVKTYRPSLLKLQNFQASAKVHVF